MTATSIGRANITGVGFWSTRLPDWEFTRAVMRGEAALAENEQSRPTPALLAPNERRRAPDTVALAIEAASQACRAANCEPSEVRSVFASTYGDLAISDYLCATLAATPTLLSPTKFHNSVHNAAAGYWTIGTRSRAAYTAISAGADTFAAGLLEAATQLICDEGPVLYVCYDIETQGPLATMISSRGLLAAALVLDTATTQGCTTIDLQVLSGEAIETKLHSTTVANYLRHNALANAIPFFEAIAAGGRQAIDLPLGSDCTLRTSLSVSD